MNFPKLSAALLAAAILAASPASPASPAWAGEGHDHGDAAFATIGQALPRFSAVSETFELVGVLSGKQITLYLDRFADNSPVRGAQIELEIGDTKFKAQAAQGRQGEDNYEVVLPEAPKPGVLPVTAMINVGNESDLLAGELDIPKASHNEKAVATRSWTNAAGWAAGGVAALALLFWGGRRVMGARSVRGGGAA